MAKALYHEPGKDWQIVSGGAVPNADFLGGVIEKHPDFLPLRGAARLEIRDRDVRRPVGSEEVRIDLIGEDSDGLLTLIAVQRAGRSGVSLLTELLAAAQTWGGRGRCRLVFVLSEASPVLERATEYLSLLAPELLIDLVLVRSYEMSRGEFIVGSWIGPNRRAVVADMGPEARPAPESGDTGDPAGETGAGESINGGESVESTHDGLREWLRTARGKPGPTLTRLLAWAVEMESDGLCRLTHELGGGRRPILLLKLGRSPLGLVALSHSPPDMHIYPRLLAAEAPESFAELRKSIETAGGLRLHSDNIDTVLSILRRAYERAAAGAARP